MRSRWSFLGPELDGGDSRVRREPGGPRYWVRQDGTDRGRAPGWCVDLGGGTTHGVAFLCRVLGVARSPFHAWLAARPATAARQADEDALAHDPADSQSCTSSYGLASRNPGPARPTAWRRRGELYPSSWLL